MQMAVLTQVSKHSEFIIRCTNPLKPACLTNKMVCNITQNPEEIFHLCLLLHITEQLYNKKANGLNVEQIIGIMKSTIFWDVMLYSLDYQHSSKMLPISTTLPGVTHLR